jgi:hypothetical protein
MYIQRNLRQATDAPPLSLHIAPGFHPAAAWMEHILEDEQRLGQE